MVTEAVAIREQGAQVLEKVLLQGDLKELTPAQRVEYYRQTCETLGLNPFTKPFDYLSLNGKLTLYAKRDATDQLRARHKVSITKLERERIDELFVVTAYATTADGRFDSSIGAVSIKGLTGEALANAMMKAETKSKRRVTLSVCGLGWTDESEVDSIPAAQTVVVDHATGEIVSEPPRQEPPKQSLRDLWTALVQVARGYDLQVPDVDLATVTPEALKAHYRSLSERVRHVEAQQAAPVEAEAGQEP